MVFKNPEASDWSDVDVRMFNCRFSTAPQYTDAEGNNPVALIFDIENEDGKTRDDQILSIGGGYKVLDGGKSVQHSRAKFNKAGADETLGFSKNSKGAVFLESLVEVAEKKMLNRAKKYGPRDAEFWEGLTYHQIEKQIEFGKPDEKGERRSYRQPVATAVYGWGVDFPDDPDAPAEPEPEPEPLPAAKGPGDFGLSAQDFETLKDLALSSPDYADFIAAAYDLDIIGSKSVQAAVDDDVNGIWGLVH